MVTGKGMSGGMYPIACVVVSRGVLGLARRRTASATSPPSAARSSAASSRSRSSRSAAAPRSARWCTTSPSGSARGLRAIQDHYPDWFVGIRQDGVVIGLEFDHPQGAKFVMRELYENGVWAIFSTLDPRVLQFKPGILLSRELVDEVLDRTEVVDRRRSPSARRLAARQRPRSSCCAGEPAGVPRARMMLQRAHWAATAFAELRPLTRQAHRRGGRRDRIPKGRTVCRVGGPGDRHGCRRAQEDQERGCSRGGVECYAGHDYVSARIDADAQDRRDAPPGRRRAGADALANPLPRSSSRCCWR